MLSHADIWGAIDRLAAESGISVSALARRSGLDATTFNRSKRQTRDGKPRWPSTESVAKVLGATSRSVADFAALVGDGGASAAALHRIPVLGYALAGRDGLFDAAGNPVLGLWDQILFPDLGDARVFALEISGDGLAPLYRDGDLLVVSPGAGISRGDRVVARTKRGEIVVKELARRTAQRIDLLPLTPAQAPLSFASEEVDWISRIVWASQ
jgi:phage repressor protein C with HTH and peptisase S24 domain